MPVFILFTIMNISTSYCSVKVIDEIYLNNQRIFILFNEYFKTEGKNVLKVEEANNLEAFYLPNLINFNNCKFIKYGQDSIY